MTYARRAFAGAAIQTTITGAINATSTTITIAASTGWPSGAEFYAVIDPGQATEEKILCTRSGTTLTCASSAKRGVDGTAAASHNNGAVIYPCVAAADLNEANDLVSEYTTRGDVVTVDSNGDFKRVGLGTDNYVFQVNGLDVGWGPIDFENIANGGVKPVNLSADLYSKPRVLTSGGLTVGNPTFFPQQLNAGEIIEMSLSAANTFLLPENSAYPIAVGTQITVVQIGTGQTEIMGSVGVTVNGTPGLKLRAQWSVAHVVKRATNTWLAWGDLAA